MTFKKCAQLFIDLNRPDWKPATIEKNTSIVHNRFEAFEDMNIQDIKVSSIKLWLNAIDDVGSKTKRSYIGVLKGVFDVALYDEVIDKNPMIHIRQPKYKSPRINPFNSDEVKDILALASEVNYNFEYFLAMGFYTGMRTGEILALKRSEIDLDKRLISIHSTRSRFGEGTPKTATSQRQLPILDVLYPFIVKMLEKDTEEYLLVTQYNKPYKDSHVFTYEWWKPILETLKLDYRRLYNTRHTYATNMLYRELCSPVELSQLLGHSSTQMIYDVYVSHLSKYLNKFDRSMSVYS